MAKSYYKYGSRPERVNVDWGEISKDFSTRLLEERNRREDLKAEISADTKKFIRTVQDTPQGQNQGVNDRMAQFAESAIETRRMQEEKLKSGELKLRDYYAQKANLEQGTNDLFEVAKNFNATFDKRMERANTNASQIEIWNNGRMQDFANPAVSEIMVDPDTGEVLVAKVVNGVPDKKNIASVFSLKSGINQEIDRVDVKDWANKTLDTYKEDFEQVLASGGSVTSKLQNPKFKEAIDKDIAAKLKTGSYTAASVLVDNTGEEYTFSTDPKDKGKDGVIVMKPDPQNPSSGVLVPDLTEEQEKEAAEVLKESILGRLGQTEEAAPKITATEINLADRRKREQTYIGYATDMITGTPDEFESAANIVISQYNKGRKTTENTITNIERLSNGIQVTFETPDGQEITKGIEAKDMKAMVNQLANITTPIDLGTAISEFNFGELEFNPEVATQTRGTIAPDRVSETSVMIDGDAVLTQEAISKAKPKEFTNIATQVLMSAFPNKNFRVTTEGYTSPVVIIEVDGDRVEFPFDNDNKLNNMAALQQYLDGFVDKKETTTTVIDYSNL